MTKIYALTDYKNQFGSKWKSKPYRSGYDKSLLVNYFSKYGFYIEFLQLKDVNSNHCDWNDKIIIYTSSEEVGLYYKDFIEDIIYGLENIGATVIPNYSFLRANNNKVFMEILLKQLLGEELLGRKTNVYGTCEELEQEVSQNKIIFPCVIKKASGAMSRGVYIAHHKDDLLKTAKKISRTPHYFSEIKELLRERKHPGYIKESKYQNKFIVQSYIPGLKNDWKVLIYGDHYYILKRGIKENDFRASGSHYDYKAGAESEFPVHMLDTVKNIYDKLDVPHLSLDFAYDGNRCYVHEIQAVHFGTSTLEFCADYYTKKDGKWITEKKHNDQEEEYVLGVVKYLKSKGHLTNK